MDNLDKTGISSQLRAYWYHIARLYDVLTGATGYKNVRISHSEPFLSTHNIQPNNRTLYDQHGIPGIYIYIPKFNWDPTNEFNSVLVHPAFIWNGVEHAGFWISKYQNVCINTTTLAIKPTQTSHWAVAGYAAASLPYQDPAVFVDFNDSIDLCEAKNSAAMRNAGNIFHVITNAEWAAIAIWVKQFREDGIFPHFVSGNNDYCRDIQAKGVTGLPLNETLTIGSSGGSYGSPYYARWRTGSGGTKTSHNLDSCGIYDMNGNVWEWIIGLQSPNANNGKDAFIIPNNEAAIATATQLKDIQATPGAPWAKIGEWASLANEDFSKENRTNWTLEAPYSIDDAEILALIANADVSADYGNDTFYKPEPDKNNVPLRGGAWADGLNAGLFALLFSYVVSTAVISFSFRSAFVGDISVVS